jgi:hypothetical protein
MTTPLPDQVDFAAQAVAGVIRAEGSTNSADIDFEFRRAQIYATIAIAQSLTVLTDLAREVQDES